MRDIVILHRSDSEWRVLSPAPARAGEAMTLQLLSGTEPLELAVRVTGSRPVILEGRVQHELRLAIEGPAGQAPAPGEMPADRTR
jgi:hypothetical protein